MCGFSASWLGATPVTLKGKELALAGLAVTQACGMPHETPASPRQTAFFKEKVVPQEGRGRQEAEKMCSLACSGVTLRVRFLTKEIPNVFIHLSTQASGLLPFLGSNKSGM